MLAPSLLVPIRIRTINSATCGSRACEGGISAIEDGKTERGFPGLTLGASLGKRKDVVVEVSAAERARLEATVADRKQPAKACMAGTNRAADPLPASVHGRDYAPASDKSKTCVTGGGAVPAVRGRGVLAAVFTRRRSDSDPPV